MAEHGLGIRHDRSRRRPPVTSLEKARALALLVPAALLAGALGSQYLGGLHPCEMCHWQRWGHYAALALALISFAMRGHPDRGRSFVWLAAIGILSSGIVGAYHAGVELKIFEGLTQCATSGSGQSLRDMLPAFSGQRERYVVWGEGSTDEMCLGILLVTRP